MENINYTTVFTCTYPHEVLTPRALLEANEIDVFVRDELTVGANPFYSNAIGGIKIQVPEKDYQRAIELLIEKGYVHPSDLKQKPTIDIDRFLLNRPAFFKKVGIILIVIILLTAGLVYFAGK